MTILSKFRGYVITIVLFLTIISAAQARYGGGSGTENNPYQIWTAEQMNAIGAYPGDWNKHFKLMADIDMSGFDGRSGRPAFNLIGPDPDPETWYYDPYAFGFSGVFDGDGHTISHLTIAGQSYLGLFCYLDYGGEVRNLGVVDVDISGLGRMGGTGALAGYTFGSLVTNCYSTGVVGSTGTPVGGLIGYNRGQVTCCFSEARIQGTSYSVGGLVGENWGHVNDCYSTGSVGGTGTWVGGLLGSNYGSVDKCYSNGTVSGRQDIGGLVGGGGGRGSDTTNSFWDTQTSKQTASSGGTGKTTAQMKTAGTFLSSGWDFVRETANGTEDIWWINEGNDYPRLSWETPDQVVPGVVEYIDPNLVGWWRFNDGAGTTAVDSSGNYHHGALVNDPLWVIGIQGGALEFIGGNHVSVQGYAGILGSHARTCAAWINVANTSASIITWGLNGNGTKWVIRTTDNPVALRVECGQGNIQGTTDLADGNWHHVAAILADDGSPNIREVKLYVDGKLDQTVNDSTQRAINTYNGGNLQIAYDLNSTSRIYEGMMDDVRIYDRALSTAEIRALMLDPGLVTRALVPDPVNGAVIDEIRYKLRWAPGDLAVSHKVYFGESFDDVNEGKIVPIATSVPFLLVGYGDQFPAGLTPGDTYYWRVDEVNEAEPGSPWKGHVWEFSVDINAEITEEPITKGFETGSFSGLAWIFYGDQNWIVTSEQCHSGAYSARAGSIDHNGISGLEITLDCTSGEISFWYKVSSESGFDYLTFYIDGEEQDKWSGRKNWTEVSFSVTEGRRTFRWEYSKDLATNSGEDTAWIDDIVFPVN